MRVLSPEQLKGRVRSFSNQKNLRSQEVLQMFFLERVLARLANSNYVNNFILKGGFLISSLSGVNERTTMDIDTTVTGIEMSEDTIKDIFSEILHIEIDDGISFEFQKIEPIREDDEYNNFRVHFVARYGKIANEMKVDITTGDVITPRAIEYSYRTIFDNEIIPVKAYNTETILAEKYETLLRRNIGTTRARDFYDLHILWNLYMDSISLDVLRLAVERTSTNRGSLSTMKDWNEICMDMREDFGLRKLWNNYSTNNAYVGELTFETVMDTLQDVAGKINQ